MWSWETIEDNYRHMIERSPQKETVFQARAMLKIIPRLRADIRFEFTPPHVVHASLCFAIESVDEVVCIWAETDDHYSICLFYPDQTTSAEVIVPLARVPDTAAAYLEQLRAHAHPTAR
jgi:hypothetical protein